MYTGRRKKNTRVYKFMPAAFVLFKKLPPASAPPLILKLQAFDFSLDSPSLRGRFCAWFELPHQRGKVFAERFRTCLLRLNAACVCCAYTFVRLLSHCEKLGKFLLFMRCFCPRFMYTTWVRGMERALTESALRICKFLSRCEMWLAELNIIFSIAI